MCHKYYSFIVLRYNETINRIVCYFLVKIDLLLLLLQKIYLFRSGLKFGSIEADRTSYKKIEKINYMFE